MEAEIPNTSTGPATVNIFPPTPIIYPSDLYSIAGETIEFAKPVIGINEPAPANFPILLNMFNPVKNALIAISAFLTGLNIFNKIGKFAGAGSLIPITGFANSIVSPAMEYKSEGYIMGVGGKMFTVAGPVLVFGISASIIVGLVYLIFNTQAITLV